MPVLARGGGAASPARPTKATALPTAAAARMGPRRGVTASSTMVFHSPQASQRPAHLAATAPQLWQTKREVGLANAVSVRAPRHGRGVAIGGAGHGADHGLVVSITSPGAVPFTVLTSISHSRVPCEALYSR